MKHNWFLAVAVVLAGACAAQADLVSGISVVVNNQVITYGEIADKVSPLLETAASVYGADRQHFEDEARRVRAQQIESLVERKLVMHDFTSTGYVTNVLESFIDDRVTKYIQDNFGGDRARFIQTLHAQGRTFEMYRRETKEDFIVNYMNYQHVDAPRKILISPLKIEQYYQDHPESFRVPDQVKLRMIVISPSADTGGDSQTRKMADEIASKLDSGASFADMANIYSKGTNGGDRGWVDRTFFKPELANVAFALKKGEHSKVIELPEACYILKVDDIHPAHIRPLKDVRADIERTLVSGERARLRQQWIDRLKRKSFIEYY